MKARSLLLPYFIASVALFVFGVAFHVLRFGSYGLPSELARRLAAPLLGMGGRFPFPFGLSVPGLGRSMPVIGAIWFLFALFWGLVFMRGILRFRGIWQPMAVLCLFEVGIRSTRFLWFPWSLQPGLCAVHSWGPVWGKIGYELSVLGLPHVRSVLIGLKILAIASVTGLIVRFPERRKRPHARSLAAAFRT